MYIVTKHARAPISRARFYIMTKKTVRGVISRGQSPHILLRGEASHVRKANISLGRMTEYHVAVGDISRDAVTYHAAKGRILQSPRGRIDRLGFAQSATALPAPSAKGERKGTPYPKKRQKIGVLS